MPAMQGGGIAGGVGGPASALRAWLKLLGSDQLEFPELAVSGQAAFGRHGQIADICAQAAEGGVAARFVQNRSLTACSKFRRLSDAF